MRRLEIPNAKVGKHGEIVIKKSLRKKYNIVPGQEVVMFDAGDHIVILPLINDPIDNLNGKYSWNETLSSLKNKIDQLSIEDIKLR